MPDRKVHWSAVLALTLVLLAGAAFLLRRAGAATNISALISEHFAWDDVAGWLDHYSTNTVQLAGSAMFGYASSSLGAFSFDCSTSPSGNICASSNYGVCNGLAGIHQSDGTCTNADASGWLSGYAWNDYAGWVSFSCQNTNPGCGTPGSPGYWGVTVDSLSGTFSGYAWSDIDGWISFNCANNSSCGTSNYKVVSSWRATSSVAYLESATVDTQSVGGATLNSITWLGVQNANGTNQQTYVDFQIAASSSSAGPWSFVGPSGTSLDYYSAPCAAGYRGGINSGGNAPPSTPICVDPVQVNNMRYLRYRVRLRSNLLQTDTPRIDNVILNWSK